MTGSELERFHARRMPLPKLPERDRWDNARSLVIWGLALAAPSLAVLVGLALDRAT